MIYVISDLHGYYYPFLKILEKIQFTDTDILYILGDLIDRGPNSMKLIDYCRRFSNMIILKGNHENMLERYLRDKSTKEIWAQNRSGGHATLKELYALHGEDLKYEQQLLEWVEKLPLYVEITVLERTYLLTHAGIGEELFLKYCKCNQYKKSHQIDLVNLFDWVMQHSDSDKNEILWDKGIFQLKEINIKDNLIIGHTPTEEMKIMRSKNIFNIDCGSYKKGGKLGCLCLDTLQEIYTNCN